MFRNWAWSAVVGVVLGVVAFAVLFVPILVWESRRFGRLRFTRTLAAGAFAVYGVTLVAYTLLPLPGPDWCQVRGPVEANLRPFAFVDRISDATRGLSPTAALRSFAVLEVVMNVVLFIPLGAFVRRLLGRSVVAATLIGVAVSLLVESTQASGLWWIYECSYRRGDVDDVLTNSTGALIGALLAGYALFWVPRPGPDEERRREPRPVTRRRRLAGMVVDAAAFYGLWVVFEIGYRLADRFDMRPSGVTTAWADSLAGVAALVIVLVLPAVLGSGASLGQRAMWLAPGRRNPDDGLIRRSASTFVRTFTGFAGFAALTLVEGMPHVAGTTAADVIQAVAVGLLGFGLGVLALDRSARGLSYRASGQAVVDARGT